MAKTIQPSQLDFLSPLHVIPGLGPVRVKAMQDAGFKTIGDLLHHFPFRYIDRSRIIPLKDLPDFLNQTVTVSAEVIRVRLERGRRPRFRVLVEDSSGQLEVLWFQGVTYVSKTMAAGDHLFLTGKISQYKRIQMVHPVVEKAAGKGEIGAFLPVYSIRESMRDAGVNQKLLIKSINWILRSLKQYPRVLPQSLETKHNFAPLDECLKKIHNPDSLSNLEQYRERLKYEELYRLAITLRWNRKKFALPGRAMKPGDLDAKLKSLLPFSLSPSQLKAIKTLYDDAASCTRMHRLLQGDVGSGKTITALFACLPALNEGLQVAWMAPTDVLARQSLQVLSSFLDRLGIRHGYLGASAGVEKNRVLKALASGEIQFVVGTHALFMPSVKFSRLGMIVIDEQHRFGAAQRLALQEKGPSSDFLLMSATPIPQTLARTLYGDLETVDILTPPGRQKVSTHIVPENKRADMEKFIFDKINAGDRVYYVVPRIENDSDDDEDTELKTVDSTVEELRSGVLGNVPLLKLHGQLVSDAREEIMRDFRDGPPAVLIATSIVEVGLDVKEATVMVVENAERFGMAQLHQLRGRVGRGEKKSYCFFLSGSEDPLVLKRLNFLCGCSDGFQIAEWDLQNRGPGEVNGFRQSGWDDLKMADILKDSAIFKEILTELESLFR